MEIIHPAVAGIDVHKKQVTVTVLTPAATPAGYAATVRVFRTFWKPLQQLAAWLIALGGAMRRWRRPGSTGGRCITRWPRPA